MSHSPRPSPSVRAFTLVEILVALTITGFVTASLVGIILQSLKIYRYEEKKITINRYIRDFTVELTGNATFANYAIIYPDFVTRSSTVSVVTNPETGDTTTSGVTVPVEDGQSGDMLVLIFVDPTNDTRIQRIVGYYRAAPSPGLAGPVRRFERTFSPSTTSPAVDLLPTPSTIASWPQVIELSEGLSDGRLFHNFYGRSIMVNGEIIQGTNPNERIARNTYNFTVSPRG